MYLWRKHRSQVIVYFCLLFVASVLPQPSLQAVSSFLSLNNNDEQDTPTTAKSNAASFAREVNFAHKASAKQHGQESHVEFRLC